MKVTTEPTNYFQPVELTVLLETKAELDAFGAICNFVPFVEVSLRTGLDLAQICKALEKHDARTSIGKLEQEFYKEFSRK